MKDINNNARKWILIIIILLFLVPFTYNMFLYFTSPRVIREPVNIIYNVPETPDVPIGAPEPKAFNDPRDSSVIQVKEYLNSTLNDPDSLIIIEWSEVMKNKDGSFLVRCKYRAKNSFGGYVTKNQVFKIDKEGLGIKSVYNY
jgi:hypothetical protein